MTDLTYLVVAVSIIALLLISFARFTVFMISAIIAFGIAVIFAPSFMDAEYVDDSTGGTAVDSGSGKHDTDDNGTTANDSPPPSTHDTLVESFAVAAVPEYAHDDDRSNGMYSTYSNFNPDTFQDDGAPADNRAFSRMKYMSLQPKLAASIQSNRTAAGARDIFENELHLTEEAEWWNDRQELDQIMYNS